MRRVPTRGQLQQLRMRDGKAVLMVDVPKGSDKPYQTQQNQFLVRVGSTNRTATQGELMRLFQQSGMFHFDLQPVERTTISDLNFTKLDQYFSTYEIDFSKEDDKARILQNTDILSESGQATVGGLLMFGINPQRYLHNASITFAHFAGNKLDEELLDKQVVTGTLDIQVDTALAIIKNHIRQPSRIQGAKTVDQVYQYPVCRWFIGLRPTRVSWWSSLSLVKSLRWFWVFDWSLQISYRNSGNL